MGFVDMNNEWLDEKIKHQIIIILIGIANIIALIYFERFDSKFTKVYELEDFEVLIPLLIAGFISIFLICCLLFLIIAFFKEHYGYIGKLFGVMSILLFISLAIASGLLIGLKVFLIISAFIIISFMHDMFK